MKQVEQQRAQSVAVSNVERSAEQQADSSARNVSYSTPRVFELGATSELMLGTWDEGYADWSAHYYHVSDRRLKTHVRSVGLSGNGLALYEFRYSGDERVFVGVMAQDLLANSAHASAVRHGPSGFYRVDYSKLGLGDLVSQQMMQAGSAAEARAVGELGGSRAAA